MDFFKSVRKSMQHLKTVGALSALVIIAGCDESGDSIGPKPDITLSGQVMKGALVGAPVNLFRASNGSINASPNIEGTDDNLYTDSNGSFSISLNGNSYRNKTLVVKVGKAVCDRAAGCTDSMGNTVDLNDEYFLGNYRCDAPEGCIDPTDGTTVVPFGDLVPIDFELIAVVPEISNDDSVRSQKINVSVLTTLMEQEILLLGGFSELTAGAGNRKIANVFQLDGINPLTQSMVDVANLSSGVTNTNSYLLSVLNAGTIAASTRPTEGNPVSVGVGLRNLISEFNNRSYQFYYRNSSASDVDLEAIYAMAQSITSHAEVSPFVSDAAKTALTEKETFVNDQPADVATDEEFDVSLDSDTQAALNNAKDYMFDTLDWYSDTAATGTVARNKFDYMMDSLRTGQQESLPYMETLGNDFTLVLAASLKTIQDAPAGTTEFTLNSLDKDGNAVEAALTKEGSGYRVEGDYLNTNFNMLFTYADSTSSDLAAEPAEGEADDSVYRFTVSATGDSVAASNVGLTLKFTTSAVIALQLDSGFDGTEETVVRSSFRWDDISLAQQTTVGLYSADLGRLTIDGQLTFSMEHVADTILRSDGNGGTVSFDVPRVDGREFVFLQFGNNDPGNEDPTKFRVTVGDTDENTGDTWPVSYLFSVRNHVVSDTERYSAEAFGSFAQDYLTGTGANQWGETACDFLPVAYGISITKNTSDGDELTYNDIDVILDPSNLDSDGNIAQLSYALSSVREKAQPNSTIVPLKDESKLCPITFTNAQDVETTVDFYESQTISETGRYDDHLFVYLAVPNLTNNHSLSFGDNASTAQLSYDDCENFGAYASSSNNVLGRLYSCATPAADSDDAKCLADEKYIDFSSGLISGKKIERVNGVIEEVDDNYSSCEDYDPDTGENEWEVRYLDGTFQVLPVDISNFGINGTTVEPAESNSEDTITLNGQVFRGAVVGAPVNIYRASNGSINASPNIEGTDDNLYTDSNGSFSISLNGNSYRNKTLVVKVGKAVCDRAAGCTDSMGNTVDLNDEYFLGNYRCDAPEGCTDPTDGTMVVPFGDLVPIDFELTTVVPLISNDNSVGSQDVNVSVLTSLIEQEILLLGGYSESSARAGVDKISDVFQLGGIDPLTHPMVDVSSISGTVDDSSWILSVVNAGTIAASTRPSEGSPVSMGAALNNLISEFKNRNYQFYYRNSGASDVDLEAIYAMAQSITSHAEVSPFVSDAAKTALTEKETFVNDQPADVATDEEFDVSLDSDTQAALNNAKDYMFDTLDWYSDTAATGTVARNKFDYMMNSLRTGQQESLPYMETLGNDFTLVLAASLKTIQNAPAGTTEFTLNSLDKDGNAVEAALSQEGNGYRVEGDYLNTNFNMLFTYADSTSSDLAAEPAEGEADDSVYQFTVSATADSVAASNAGLTLKFTTSAVIALQLDSGFDGTEETVVRSSFRWDDISLAQQATDGLYSADLGRLTIDGQLTFSMEHVADTILRSDGNGGTVFFDVPRVDGREFVFSQFGNNDPGNEDPTKFRVTVGDTDENTGDTWPVSYLFSVRNHVVSDTGRYSAEAFGSFAQDYLSGTGANQWGETACDFLPVAYGISITKNTSDGDELTYNDIDVILDPSNLDSDGNIAQLSYALSSVREKAQPSSTIVPLKDESKLCPITFTNAQGVETDVDFYESQTISETGRYDDRLFVYLAVPNLTNNHTLSFGDNTSTAQ
ncbi:hypothetical protein, partial [Litoribacillus peritrichatus]